MEPGGFHVQSSLCPLSPMRNRSWSTFPPGMKMQQHVCNAHAQESPLDTQHPRLFPGDWSHRYPLSSTYQETSLPEGKQEFGRSHTVCTNIIGTVSYSHLLTGDWGRSDKSSFQMPDKVQPCKQAFLRTAVSRLLG